MPTYHWGRLRRPMGNRRRADAGVTLIEILVVLALIGVSAGVVMYALPSASQARNLNQEAALLTARLNLASERSLINGTFYRLNWVAQGYSFDEWSDGAWRNAGTAPLSEAHSLGAGMTLTDEGTGPKGGVEISPDLMPSGAAVVRLRISADTRERFITFDGASATLLEPVS